MKLGRMGRRPRRGGCLVAAAALLALGASAACTSSLSPHPSPTGGAGTVVGDAPICYGPGPDLNLKPRITITATPLHGGTPAAIVIATSDAHHSYRMTLQPGIYKISTYSGSATAEVRAGMTLTGVNLPQPGCL